MSFLSKMFAQGSGSNPFTPRVIDNIDRPELPPPTPPLPPVKQEPRIPIYDKLFQREEEGQPQNTVFQDAIPLVERQRLAQRAAEMQSRERISGERIASQENLRGRELDIRQQRADVYAFKAKNPGLRITVGQDGITRAFNPVDGSLIDLGRTGMSQEEIASLNQENALERIGAQGESARSLQELRHRNALDQIGARGDISRELAELRAALSTERPQLATQQKAAVQLRYNQMINENPGWKEFVRMNPNTGMPELKQDSTGLFGSGIAARKVPPETRKAILAYLYPEQEKARFDTAGRRPEEDEEEEVDDIDELINRATGGKPPAGKN